MSEKSLSDGGERGWGAAGRRCRLRGSSGPQAVQPTMGFSRGDQGSFADLKDQDSAGFDLLIKEAAADRTGVAELAHRER